MTPWIVAHHAPLSMGFSRQEYWSGLPFPSPGNLPDTGIKPRSPALQIHSLPTELWGNDILALHIKFTKDICTYKVSGGSSWPLTRLRKKHFLLRSYPAYARRRKTRIFVVEWVFLSLVRADWLTQNADAQYTLKGRRRPKKAEKQFYV